MSNAPVFSKVTQVKTRIWQLAWFSPLVVTIVAVFVIALDQRPLSDWFLTADQQAEILYEKGQYEKAATTFADPTGSGAAWFRASEFEQAARAFMRMDTAVAQYNRGNALVMQGEYESAVEAFDRSLELQPNWEDAMENREIARMRAERLDFTGGDMTGGEMEADDIEFDFDAEGGQDPPEATVDEGQTLNDEEVQALWLRRVQTEPADFLRARFAYQQAMAGRAE